ncbi:MAG: tetratricopeptide repeat protein [Bacteroidota bacterium]
MVNSNPQYSDRIDAYFDNAMNAEERQSFLKELENNSKLKREFDFQLEVQQAISDPGYDEVNAVIEEVLYPRGRKSSDAKKNSNLKSIFMYAAVIVFVLTLAFLFLQKNNVAENTPAALVADYFEPYPAYNTFRGESNIQGIIESAFQRYESGKFESASADFKLLSTAHPENMAYLFYEGNAQFALGNYQAARQLFQQVIDNETDLFVKQAKWYLALSYLALEDQNSALLILQEIQSDQGSTYKLKASELIDLLLTTN